MCFSATASFVAGTSLSAIGVATISKVRHRSEMPLALIPLLFGIQQLIEGGIWLTFSRDAPMLRQSLTYGYSLFSHVLWPIYVPFAFRFLETEPWRRNVMQGFQVAGVAAGGYLWYSLIARPIVAEVIGSHILYDSPHFYVEPVIALYVAATCFTGFVSSHTFVRMFGVMALLSFLATYLLAARALVSVWCFFAAILSLLIYVHLRYRNLGGFPKDKSAMPPIPPATTT